MSNRQLEERFENDRNADIANQLGISVEDLGETNWSIEEKTGNDDFSFGHYVKFKDGSPREILDKIVGLNENDEVDVHFTDEPDEDEDDFEEGGGFVDSPEHHELAREIAEKNRKSRDEGDE